jgi:branched-chain amino acid transport system ATP-binding protein
MTLLTVKGLSVRYGPIIAVRHLDLDVDVGEIVCLVGPNGAGKSSTTLAIAGALLPSAGTILMDGKDIARQPAERLAMAGMSLVPEGRRIFGRMTVQDNLIAACLPGRRPSDDPEIFSLFPILRERMGQLAGLLSGGEQQQLAIARAMLRKPRLMIVDEPSLGLSPRFVDIVFGALRQLRDHGVSLLVVEQSARRALGLADRIYLMRSGEVVMAGRSESLAQDPEFEAAYFGKEVAR